MRSPIQVPARVNDKSLTLQDSHVHALGLEAGARVEEIVGDVDVTLADHVHHFKVEAAEHAPEREVDLGVGQVQPGAHPGAFAEGDEVALQPFLTFVGQPAVRVEDGWLGVDVGVVVDQHARHGDGRAGRDGLAVKGEGDVG